MAKRKRSNDFESGRKILKTISNVELNQAEGELTPTMLKENMTSAPIDQNGMKSCAVLVDSENVSYRNIPWILQKLESMGYNAAIRRAYGDFSGNHSLRAWQAIETDLSFKQVQAHTYVRGKNTSDFALYIGAMDMLMKDQNLECFVLVTSDSDFTLLVKRLKEAGKEVLGFGKKQTPLPLVNEYDRFIYIEIPPTKKLPLAKNLNLTKEQLIHHLSDVINEYSDIDGWANFSRIGQHFPCKDYGYSRISKYFAANNKHFELQGGRVRNRLSVCCDASRSGVDGDVISGIYGSDTKTSVSVGEPKNLTEEPVTKIDSPPMHLTDGRLIQQLTNVINEYTDNYGWADLSKIIPHYPYNRGGCLGLFKFFAANKEHFQLQRRRKLRRSRVRNRLSDGSDASTSGVEYDPFSESDDTDTVEYDPFSESDGTDTATSGSDGTDTTSATNGTHPVSGIDGAGNSSGSDGASTGGDENDTSSENYGEDGPLTATDGTHTPSGADGPDTCIDQLRSYTTSTIKDARKILTEDQVIQHARNLIVEQSNEDGWARLSNIRPHFPWKDYGYSTISKYFEAYKKHFVLQKGRVCNRLSDDQLFQFLTDVIYKNSDEDGWASLSCIGHRFPSKDYGYSKISKYFEAHNEHFQIDKVRSLVRNRFSDGVNEEMKDLPEIIEQEDCKEPLSISMSREK